MNKRVKLVCILCLISAGNTKMAKMGTRVKPGQSEMSIKALYKHYQNQKFGQEISKLDS